VQGLAGSPEGRAAYHGHDELRRGQANRGFRGSARPRRRPGGWQGDADGGARVGAGAVGGRWGRRGAFDAAYDASTGIFTITLKLKVTAENDGTSAWTPAEIATWQTQYQTAIQARWGGQYTMQCTKAGWEALSATTKIVLSWVAANPHFELKVKKLGSGISAPTRR
jgi:hypothetical protein